MELYTKDNYIDLAFAVRAGLPESEALKIIEEQRELGANPNDEKHYWMNLKLKSAPSTTTIRISRKLKRRLDDLKKDADGTIEDVISWLLLEHKALELIFERNLVDRREVNKIINKELWNESNKMRGESDE